MVFSRKIKSINSYHILALSIVMAVLLLSLIKSGHIAQGESTVLEDIDLSGDLSGIFDYSGQNKRVVIGDVAVTPYDGLSTSTGIFEVRADEIIVNGQINAVGSGYGGGGGGGGGGAPGYSIGGTGGQGGAGSSGGKKGFNGQNSDTNENNPGLGGAGGQGGGSFGGPGGAGGSYGGQSTGGNGQPGGMGGYLGVSINGDASMDSAIYMGSGGGGGGGGTAGRSCDSHCPGDSRFSSGGAGAGGGAGNRGGGMVKLIAVKSIVINGSINTAGEASHSGNGSKGTDGVCGGHVNGTAGGMGGSSLCANNCASSGGAAGNKTSSSCVKLNTSWGKCQNVTPNDTKNGGAGGSGAAGAGGGILLRSAAIDINGTIDARGGGGNSENGGTLKIFYADSYKAGSYQAGRILVRRIVDLKGYAWSANMGWISFNCANLVCANNRSKACATDQDCGGDSCSDSCASASYNVSMDMDSGQLSGYAWNSDAGWIYFGPDQDMSAYGLGMISSSSAPAAARSWAYADMMTGQVRGWALILSLQDYGWIRMDSAPDHGVVFDPGRGVFSGWAWNGNADNSGMGWVSFNCLDNYKCAQTPYKVYTQIEPSAYADNLRYDPIDGCVQPVRNHTFRWDYTSGDTVQAAFSLVVDDNEDFSSPAIYHHEDGYRQFFAMNDDQAGKLDYGKRYYWQIKVWGENGNATASTTGPYFDTYRHEFPRIVFSWSPQEVRLKQRIVFSDQSVLPANVNKKSWLWSAPGAEIEKPEEKTTGIIFNKSGDLSVSLKVTDEDEYYCQASASMNIGASVPKWQEIAPR